MAGSHAGAASSGGAVARFADEAERGGWDALVAANPGGGEVWMGEAYLTVKREQGGYRDYRVVVERPGRSAVAVGVLAKRVPLLGEWWHLPAGPAGEDAAAVLETAAAVAGLARSRGAFLLKIEPRLDPGARDAIRAAGYRDTVRIIPNPSTVLVDLGEPGRSDEQLLAGLGKKARNSITRAGRDGIVASRVPATDENCAALYRLLRETAEGRFVLRSEQYYRAFWQGFERAGSSGEHASRASGSGAGATAPGSGQMFFAHRAGADGAPELIAGAYAMALGDKTTYKDGASVRAKSAYGASHALQWEVLRWAAERGARTHDLCGAPPADRADDREHPLFGVGQFKRSFAPEITDYAGAFDLPLKPWAYAFWTKLGDRLARRWSLAVRKDPYY